MERLTLYDPVLTLELGSVAQCSNVVPADAAIPSGSAAFVAALSAAVISAAPARTLSVASGGARLANEVAAAAVDATVVEVAAADTVEAASIAAGCGGRPDGVRKKSTSTSVKRIALGREDASTILNRTTRRQPRGRHMHACGRVEGVHAQARGQAACIVSHGLWHLIHG